MHQSVRSSAPNGADIASVDGDGAGPEIVDGRTRSPLLQISNAMVRLYKEAFGRGPTKARSQFVGTDTLVVVLEDSMTVAEHNQGAMNEQRGFATPDCYSWTRWRESCARWSRTYLDGGPLRSSVESTRDTMSRSRCSRSSRRSPGRVRLRAKGPRLRN
jgi:hypothetical protein